jgi:GT2 family glycosyltransferase
MLNINKTSFCSVNILNYNGREHLETCLDSLLKQTYKNMETVITDNASTDDSVDFIKKNYPLIKVVINKINSGTAGGFNFGAQYGNGEFILFLANDIQLNQDVIEKLMATLLSDEKIAICSPKMLRYFHRDTIDYAGFKLDIFGFPYIFGAHKKDDGRYDQIKEAMPTGTVLLIRKAVFDEVGGFDDKFFTLADELDLSWRIRLLGYKSVINPFAVVYHKAGITLRKKRRYKLRYYSEKNTIRMLLKNYALSTLVWIMPLYFTLLFGELSFYIFILRFDMAYAILKSVFWNIFNIGSTLKLRYFIQRKRKVIDSEILRERTKKSYKLDIFMEFLRGEYKIFK